MNEEFIKEVKTVPKMSKAAKSKYLIDHLLVKLAIQSLPKVYSTADFKHVYQSEKAKLVNYLGVNYTTVNNDIRILAGSEREIPRQRIIAYSKYFGVREKALLQKIPTAKTQHA